MICINSSRPQPKIRLGAITAATLILFQSQSLLASQRASGDKALNQAVAQIGDSVLSANQGLLNEQMRAVQKECEALERLSDRQQAASSAPVEIITRVEFENRRAASDLKSRQSSLLNVVANVIMWSESHLSEPAQVASYIGRGLEPHEESSMGEFRERFKTDVRQLQAFAQSNQFSSCRGQAARIMNLEFAR